MENLKRVCVLSVVFILFFAAGYAHAGNFGVGAHSGYGMLKYEENVSSDDTVVDEASSTLRTIIFGVSGEYTFPKYENLFTGIVTDWAVGLKDQEKFTKDGETIQTNDINIFAQFYDVRFGYKNSLDNFYYRGYLSGGWDGFYFRRKNFVVDGIAQSTDVITEDFSLWRVGAGLGAGYKFGKWAVDGRAAYAYYFDGEVRNSGHGGLVFDTNGTCLDAGLGIIREITSNINLYVGGSYTLIDLDESEVVDNFIFPHSRTQIMTGIVNVTYAF